MIVGNKKIAYLLNYVLLCYSFFRICIVKDIDECASSPCHNDGSCNDEVNKFSCTCAGGFEGAICQTGRSLSFRLQLVSHDLCHVTEVVCVT